MIGRKLILIGEIAALWTFLFGLLPFHFGFWIQCEPTTLALHLSSALVGLGLLISVLDDRSDVGKWLTNAPLAIPLAMGGLSLLAVLFADFPLTTVLGNRQTGQGATWFLDIAVLMWGGLALRGSRKTLRTLALAAGLAVLAMAFFQLPELKSRGWFSFPKTDFLAMPAIAAAGILIAGWPVKSWYGTAGTLLLCLSVVAYSDNQVALVLLLFTGIAGGFLALVLPRIWRWSGLWGCCAVGVPLVVSIGVVAAGSWEALDTLATRKEMYKIVLRGLFDQPHRILTGFGWGHWNDFLIQYGLHTGTDFFLSADGAVIAREGLRNAWPHTHNILLESLLALGIVGTALMLAWFYQLSKSASKREVPQLLPFVIAYVGLWAAWFHQPFTAAFPALLFSGCVFENRAKAIKPFIPAVVLCIVLLVQLSSAALVYRDAAASTRELENPSADPMSPPWEKPSPFGRPDRGGHGIADLLLLSTGTVAEITKCNCPLKPEDRYFLQRRLHLAAERMEAGETCIGLETAYLQALGRVTYTLPEEESQEISFRHLPRWARVLERVLGKAPHRTDLAIPYLSWALTAGHHGEMRSLLAQVRTNDPLDPVGLWFSGAVLLFGDAQEHQDGFRMLREALAMGIEGYMDIDPDLLAQISGKDR